MPACHSAFLIASSGLVSLLLFERMYLLTISFSGRGERPSRLYALGSFLFKLVNGWITHRSWTTGQANYLWKRRAKCTMDLSRPSWTKVKGAFENPTEWSHRFQMRSNCPNLTSNWNCNGLRLYSTARWWAPWPWPNGSSNVENRLSFYEICQANGRAPEILPTLWNHDFLELQDRWSTKFRGIKHG